MLLPGLPGDRHARRPSPVPRPPCRHAARHPCSRGGPLVHLQQASPHQSCSPVQPFRHAHLVTALCPARRSGLRRHLCSFLHMDGRQSIERGGREWACGACCLGRSLAGRKVGETLHQIQHVNAREGRLQGCRIRIGRWLNSQDARSGTNAQRMRLPRSHGVPQCVHLLREVLRRCGPSKQARWCGQGEASGRPSIARIRACHDRNGSFTQSAASPRICWVQARRAVRSGRAGRLIGRCCWRGLHQRHLGGFDVHA